MKVTRRSLAGIIAAPAFLSRQAQAQAQVPSQAEPNAARAEFQSAARQIAAVKLPRTVEPATRFEA